MSKSFEHYVSSVLRALADPVLSMQDSNERVYYPYLLGAALLSTAVWARKLRGRVSLARFLFPKEIWLHSSSLFDLRFMVVRAILSVLVLGPIVLSSAHLATTLHLQMTLALGAAPWLGDGLPALLALSGVTLAAFLGEDFARFGVHAAAHRVPVLWELHKVHHSARVLTPLTIYRTHPLEGVLMRSGASLGLAVAAAVSAWALGAQLTAWQVLGVHGVSFLWNLGGSNLRHSHVWVRYPKWLEHILISPAQHQIHHSDQQQHFDRNFGSAFALWDWMFGSLYVPEKRERLTFGLPESETNHQDRVVSALVDPVASAAKRLRWGGRTSAA